MFARPSSAKVSLGYPVYPPAIYSGGQVAKLGRANYTINIFHTDEESAPFTAWFFNIGQGFRLLNPCCPLVIQKNATIKFSHLSKEKVVHLKFFLFFHQLHLLRAMTNKLFLFCKCICRLNGLCFSMNTIDYCVIFCYLNP